MTSVKRMAVFIMLLAVSSLLPADVAQACSQKCKREVDRNFCEESGGFLAGRNCQEWQECTTRLIDPDGNGPGAPQLYITCEYKCAIEYCNWV